MRGLLAGCVVAATLVGIQGEAAGRALAPTLDLAPNTASLAVGETHTLTATVDDGGQPLPGQGVTFAVVQGPHAGVSGKGTTGSDGKTTFSYTGRAAGTDTIDASWTDFERQTHTDRVQATWSTPPPEPPPSADLGVSLAPAAPGATVGAPVTFTATVSNGGPSPATGVALGGSVSAQVALASTAPSQGTCSRTGNSFTCALGGLGAGGSATVALSGIVTATGEIQAMVSVSGEQSDPSPAGNAASTSVPAALPPPVPGRAVNAGPLRGVVLVNGRRLLADQQIPVGAIVDARRGTVELESANGTGNFWAGRFRIAEGRARNGITTLVLLGGNFKAGCGHPARAPATHRKKVVRRLWGDGRGRFRTKGRHAAATVRGTWWQTADRCDGTLVGVRQGRVDVLDTVRRKKVVVRAGKSYLARPR